ncbi:MULTISPECIES: response regulator [Desulfococcus]|jgi:DNA-binding NtrC family response regulator|uniref:Response regulator receiver protein n=1 Tax=Desulfococcus multivorans DSM 2059 TaxID=1121405 RepID=S7U0P0_DESML|nr:response regulator [Desulfococcus multivorans]AOY58365.1 two component system response regulator [Desulfococcus multivorans]AQV00697.1 response regulator [Desulfococcus multivorans]EPR42560.1 response regulator receiver protein [Desulfococcus multivorans DSM 2059]MDX9818870.1 response regulator [Desulfococcus multivorans]SKA18703.1 Response regulator receiver domain-containing protein [Desulfococcus multivorans DSM 2059]
MDKISLLLVDDEVEFLAPMVKRLKRRNYHVQTSTSGPDALDFIRKNPVELVVLDVQMPGMDGIETLAEIKRIDPSIGVVMLTGHANIEAAIAGMELGAFDYLMKPMNFDELVYKLQDVYREKQILGGKNNSENAGQ